MIMIEQQYFWQLLYKIENAFSLMYRICGVFRQIMVKYMTLITYLCIPFPDLGLGLSLKMSQSAWPCQISLAKSIWCRVFKFCIMLKYHLKMTPIDFGDLWPDIDPVGVKVHKNLSALCSKKYLVYAFQILHHA